MLVEGASTKQEPTARVVGLAGSLNPDIFRAQGSYESVQQAAVVFHGKTSLNYKNFI